jgi:prevent-host-death family protein
MKPGASMSYIEATELGEDARVADLLDRLRPDEEVTITQRGVPVARVVLLPLRPARDEKAIEEAMRGMDEIRARTKLGGLDIKELINEGRP